MTKENGVIVEWSVTHVFTPEEVTQLRKDITDKTLMLGEKENVKKSVSATVTMLKSTISEQVIKVREGREVRKALCPVEFRWDDNKKDILHPDNGEVVYTMDITPADREQNLPMEGAVKSKSRK